MVARSTISIQNKNGTYDSIYCHWGGYPSGVGSILFLNYETEEKVRELIGLSSIVKLGKSTSPEETLRYHRWRGEELNKLDLIRLSEEYNYVFQGGQWFLLDSDGDMLPLSGFLNTDNTPNKTAPEGDLKGSNQMDFTQINETAKARMSAQAQELGLSLEMFLQSATMAYYADHEKCLSCGEVHLRKDMHGVNIRVYTENMHAKGKEVGGSLCNDCMADKMSEFKVCLGCDALVGPDVECCSSLTPLKEAV